jgi:hypothetical protein
LTFLAFPTPGAKRLAENEEKSANGQKNRFNIGLQVEGGLCVPRKLENAGRPAFSSHLWRRLFSSLNHGKPTENE